MTKFTHVTFVSGLSFFAGALSVVIAGCSGAEDGTGTDKAEKPGGTTTTPTTPKPQPSQSADPTEPACSVAGQKGNNIGVGQFCSKTVDECGRGTFCQAAFAPEGAQFCTKLCVADSECGEGAICFKEARGSACVPNKCLGK